MNYFLEEKYAHSYSYVSVFLQENNSKIAQDGDASLENYSDHVPNMPKAILNHPVSDLLLQGTNNLHSKMTDFKGKNIILYFYPKDNTPGCTSEAKLFRDHYPAFEKLNTIVMGVSRDTLASHENYKQKLQLPFELISDQQEILCQYFDVIKIKNFFGKKIRGIVRSTFLIDEKGVLRHEWRKVKINEHIHEVLSFIERET